MRITILGCGSSGGVPRVGSGWGECDPGNPRNRRRRCSILVTRGEPQAATTVLVDTSPDLREQLLDSGVRRLDAVVYTHEHADHTHGIDDLRPLALVNRRLIDAHLDAPTSRSLRAKFGYCFETPPGSSYPPIMREHRLHPGRPLEVAGDGGVIEVVPFRVSHGDIDALGLRFGAAAYTPDVKTIPDESLPFLEGLDLWIVDALRPKPHPTHFSLSDALAWIERMRPRRAILTNLHTDLDYDGLRVGLPPGIEPAFDGMRVEVT